MRRTLRVLTVFGLAVLVSMVLSATGGAAKPSDSMTCSISAGTTFTWISGTIQILYEWDRTDGTATAQGNYNPTGNGPGSVNLTSIGVNTPTDAAILKATFNNKRGPDARPAPVTCTP